MTVGVILSCYNHFYFRRYVSVFHEFLPQMIFLQVRLCLRTLKASGARQSSAGVRCMRAVFRWLQSIFGYLSVTIIFKWCTDWTGRNAPSLLDMLINMFVSPFKVLPPEDVLYEGQTTVQMVLLFLALLCVPWMLLVRKAHAPGCGWASLRLRSNADSVIPPGSLTVPSAAHAG